MQVHPAGLETLKNIAGVNVTTIDPCEDARPLPPDIIKDTNFLFCTTPPTNLDQMTNLDVIQIASAGYTQLFNLGLTEKKIRACNAAGVNDIPIAQWNLAMMINLVRDLRGMLRNQQAGIWERPARFQSDNQLAGC